MNAYKLREALNKPHVRKWIMDEKRLQLEAINAGNPEAPRHLRDTSENAMAAVGAIKTLGAMKELVDPSVGVRATSTRPAWSFKLFILTAACRRSARRCHRR